MEKCTDVQPHNARIEAAEDRSIRTARWMTACQQACPTQAVVSATLTIRHAYQSSAQQLNYGAEEVNTWPRTTFWRRCEPNADLAGKEPPAITVAGTRRRDGEH